MTNLPIERCIQVVLATFGALSGFALVTFITTAPPNAPNPIQSRPDELNWLIFALAALLLRYMLGSAVHLYRTYVPPTPLGTPALPDWWTIIFFFKDFFFDEFRHIDRLGDLDRQSFSHIHPVGLDLGTGRFWSEVHSISRSQRGQ
jgi:hypothetical protein